MNNSLWEYIKKLILGIMEWFLLLLYCNFCGSLAFLVIVLWSYKKWIFENKYPKNKKLLFMCVSGYKKKLFWIYKKNCSRNEVNIYNNKKKVKWRNFSSSLSFQRNS